MTLKVIGGEVPMKWSLPEGFSITYPEPLPFSIFNAKVYVISAENPNGEDMNELNEEIDEKEKFFSQFSLKIRKEKHAIDGKMEFNPKCGTILTAGWHTLEVYFYPTNLFKYRNTIRTVRLLVNKGIVSLKWSKLLPIFESQDVTNTLNCINNQKLPGKYTYSTPTVASIDSESLKKG